VGGLGDMPPTFRSRRDGCVVFPHFLGVEIKIVATRCADFKDKMHPIQFSLLYAPDTAVKLTALPRIAGFKGTYF